MLDTGHQSNPYKTDLEYLEDNFEASTEAGTIIIIIIIFIVDRDSCQG